ncbi:unnamed protein product [Oreochromis niloticus]|nr:unnamed protein product [Mustela putorius furo]
MCKQDGSWFQAVVLTALSPSARRRREAPVMTFTRVSSFDFLPEKLETRLSPALNTTATPTNAPITTTTSSTYTTTMATTTNDSNSVFDTSGGRPGQAFIFAIFNLLSLTLCLQLFL